MKIIKVLPLMLILFLGSGCFILPIPLSSDHEEEIDKLQGQIAVGSTTREEVISIIGEPDVTREGYIMYRKKEIDGGTLIIWGFFMDIVEVVVILPLAKGLWICTLSLIIMVF